MAKVNKEKPRRNLKVIKGKKRSKKNSILYGFAAVAILLVALLVLHLSTPTGVYEQFQNAYALTVDSGDNYMVDPNAIVVDFKGVGSGAFLLTNTYFEIFNNSGNNVLYYKHGFANPSMDVSESRVLVFDRGGKKYKIFNYSSVLLEGTQNNEIISADLSRNGKIAFITSSSAYASELKVYNLNNVELFTWNSNNVLSAVSFNKSASLVAVSGVYSESGLLSSKIDVINAKNGTTKFTLDFYGEVISSIFEYSGKIIAASEGKVYIINWKNGEYTTIDTEGIISFLYENNHNQLVLVYSREDKQTFNNICTYTNKFKLKSSFVVNAVLYDLITDKNSVYAVYDNKMNIYNHSGELLDSISHEANIQRVAFVGNKILACGTSKISILKELRWWA